MTRGFLIFAHNNEQIDYAAIALCNALMIKSHLAAGVKVCLVTDAGSHNWLVESRGDQLVSAAFDDIIIREISASGKKRYHDTLSTARDLPWHNSSRSTAYDLSPYDETILIDADYLVMDSTLDHVWGSTAPYRMNSRAVKITETPLHPNELRLEPCGIEMFWATCVYFRKNPEAKLLFDMVEHVRENYAYYQHLYRFPGSLFRNDYAFSIAAHVLGNWIEGSVESLPCDFILTSFDCDELIGVPAKSELHFLVNDEVQRYKFSVAKVKGVSIHIMNKFSIGRHVDRLIEIYSEAA